MRRFSLGYQVLFAVVLGVFVGLFAGPLCKALKPIGDAFIMLLQMVVLPYICFSLIHGFGSLSPSMGKRLFKSGWPFLLLVWGLTFAMIYLLSQLIPEPDVVLITSPSAHRDSDLQKNFLSFLVPENPFYDLANNVVPAVAMFGLIVGCALMHIEKKEPLCSLMERLNQTIEKILHWLALISPIGAFAHIAYAVGTVHFDDLAKLEFYIVCFVALSLFTVLWVLPQLIACLTPLSYRDALRGIKSVCLLPFVTGLPTIAIPFITTYLKTLGERHREKHLHETSQTVIPIAYSFGQIGNCTILFFFFFLSFYYRHPFIGPEKGLLSLLTVPMSIGSSATSINAVTFLIQQLNFPPDSIELFTETMAITLNFQVLMSIAGVLTLIILVLYAYYGLLKVRWTRLFVGGGATLLVFWGCVMLFKQSVHLDDKYADLYPKLQISEVISNPVEAIVASTGGVTTQEEPLQRILRTGVLRVGYMQDNIPYCYENERGELVGYDIAYAYQLARDLDCKLEFVQLNIDQLQEELGSGAYDIAMAAILMIEQRLAVMDFTHPYTEQDNVLLIPLSKKRLFLNLETASQNPALTIGATGGYSYVLQRHFPQAKPIYSSMLQLEQQFAETGADGWIWSRIPAFVWCLSHPDYAIVDYGGLIGKRYFAYPVRNDSPDFISFLNNWLLLKEESGFKAEMYNYWIRGVLPKEEAPRWSILQSWIEKKS